MTAASERQKRYVQRQRAETAIIPVEVDVNHIADAMVEAALISEAESTSRKAIGAAASRLLSEWASKIVTRQFRSSCGLGKF